MSKINISTLEIERSKDIINDFLNMTSKEKKPIQIEVEVNGAKVLLDIVSKTTPVPQPLGVR